MKLQDWIEFNLTEFGVLDFWTLGMGAGTLTITTTTEGKELVNHNELIAYSCYAGKSRHDYYILWDGKQGYRIRIDDTTHSPHRSRTNILLYDKVFGNPNWKEFIETEFPELLTTCHDCNCYNDKLVTGWCKGKIKEVSIWS